MRPPIFFYCKAIFVPGPLISRTLIFWPMTSDFSLRPFSGNDPLGDKLLFPLSCREPYTRAPVTELGFSLSALLLFWYFPNSDFIEPGLPRVTYGHAPAFLLRTVPRVQGFGVMCRCGFGPRSIAVFFSCFPPSPFCDYPPLDSLLEKEFLSPAQGPPRRLYSSAPSDRKEI